MQRAFVGNAASEEQVKEAEKKVSNLDMEMANDLRLILSTAGGRRYIWRHLGKLGLFDGGYAPSPHEMAFDNGRREAGLRIMGDIMRWAPELWLKMQLESHERTEKKNA